MMSMMGKKKTKTQWKVKQNEPPIYLFQQQFCNLLYNILKVEVKHAILMCINTCFIPCLFYRFKILIDSTYFIY